LVRLLRMASLINGPMQDGVAIPNGVALNELKIIMCMGSEGAIAGHDITEIMAIPPMNVSRALASLHARGWIEPVVEPENRRRKPFQLSQHGWTAYRQMTPDVSLVAETLLGALSANERDVLARVVEKIGTNMADWIIEHHAGVKLKRSR
jgi:DNA-binding MarR family transcriptional regulator